jgi:nucleoid-associated protein YgaU
MRRLTDFIKGFLALALILLLLVGVPAALVVFAGNPVDDARQLFADDLLSDDTAASLALRAGLTVLAWLAWAQIAFSIVMEFVALARGRVAGRASLLPGVQDLARRLVVATTLLVNAFTSTTGAVALMPLTVPAPIESVEVDLLRPPDLEAPAVTVSEDAPSATYTSVAGDTFWSLAESMLGDGLRWAEIREANIGRSMADGTAISETTEVVRAGWELVVPSDAVLPLVQQPDMPEQLELAEPIDGAAPEMLGRWEVAGGDHFWAIAEETLTAAYGRPVTDDEITPYWREIIDANRDRLVTADPDLVHPGQTFDVALPPLADELVIGLDAADDEEADGAAAEGVTKPRREWTAVDDPVDRGTLKPFEPANGDGGPGDGSTVALGVFGTAVGAGALVELLRRRRLADANEHESGASDSSPDPVGEKGFEARIRPIANTDAVRWLAATNRYLTRQLRTVPQDMPLPAVLAMRAGEFGIEVLLDEPSEPPAGFVADGVTGAAWRLAVDADLDTIEAAGRGAQPYSPGLLPVGETDAGDLLVDLEQLAVVSLVGDIGTIAGWLATVATAATAMSWSQTCSIVAIGVQTVLGGSNQVQVPTDVEGWATETIAAHTESARAAGTSTYRQRLDAADAPFVANDLEGPTVVLLGPGHDDLARRLMAVAELAHSSLVLVTTTALDGHARIELHPDHGVVVPDDSGVRLDFDPVVTGSATSRYAAKLIAADHDRRYADVFDTVRRRPLDPADDSDDAVPHHLWPPPSVPASEESRPIPENYSVEASAATDPSGVDWPPPTSIEPTGATPDGLLLEPRPIEVRVMAGAPSVIGAMPMSPRAEEILIYLAVVRSTTPEELDRLFLSGVATDELDTVATAAGVADDGSLRVWFDEPTGRYWVSGDVESDYHRFGRLVSLADGAGATASEQAFLEAALGLVDEMPMTELGGERFSWLMPDHPVRSTIDMAVVDAAHRLGELALAEDRADLASWAAGRGLTAVPGQESLHRIQMRVAADRNDRQGVEDAYRAAVEAMEQVAPWDGLQPETDALYRELVEPMIERS